MIPPTLRVSTTADLEPGDLERARKLLGIAFDDLTESDWEHSLGGTHVLALHEGDVVGHAALVQRRLIHGGVALRAGYVEGVAVHPAHQRRGLGGRMMAVLERAILRAFEVGALGASDAGLPFYASRGWVPWRGQLSGLTPRGIIATPEEQGGVFVLIAGRPLELDGELICDFRGGDLW